MGYKDPEVAKQKHREYMRLHRETRKKFHLCGNCKEQDAYTLAGHLYCAECSEKQKQYSYDSYHRHYEEINAKASERRKERAEKHLCTECGKKLPSGDNHRMCAHCRAVGRAKHERAQIWQGKVDRDTMRVMGVCTRCGAPRMQGEKAFGGEIMLCESCYRKSCDSLVIARAAYEAKYGHTWGQAQAACEGLGRSKNHVSR